MFHLPSQSVLRRPKSTTYPCLAFFAVDRHPLHAATTGLAYFGLAGEKAAALSSGPGTFQIALLDALYVMKEEELKAGARIQV